MLDMGVLRRVRLQPLVAVGGRATDYQVGAERIIGCIVPARPLHALRSPWSDVASSKLEWGCGARRVRVSTRTYRLPLSQAGTLHDRRLCACTRSVAFAKKSPNSRLAWPAFSHNRAAIGLNASHRFHQQGGCEMRGSRRWGEEVRELGHTALLGRTAPREVWAERDNAWRVEQTPNMAVLGDPLPGRSALDAKTRLSPR